jgi:site-specific recombinase XerD
MPAISGWPRRGGVWRVRQVRAELPAPASVPAGLACFEDCWDAWLEAVGIPVGTPLLVSPSFDYDVELNRFFYAVDMLASRMTTRLGYARDLAAFLTFLHGNRSGRSWRDATTDDHAAYLIWRRHDSAGPQVGDATWDREVAGVNRFYRWQQAQGNVARNPVPQRGKRAQPSGSGRRLSLVGEDGQTPATYSHGAHRERISWLPAASYRKWRDIGVCGYGADGLPRAAFRGRWAARNAAFCDLMVRTGLRLSEQSALSLFEVPLDRGLGGYQKFWLPPAIAKGGSARWIYLPSSLVADLVAYVEIDRAEVVADARAKGRYRRMGRPFIVADVDRAVAVESRAAAGGSTVKVAHLTPEERRRLLIETPDGLEPAAFWLSEDGLPVTLSTWKNLFTQANACCRRHGVNLRAHAHLLRHTFAVVTLEQLQRGHLAALAELNVEQRGHYTRIFGDPLDWVRRRLGHRSITTTQIYLHALGELEMETRMALVPDDWEDPRDTPAAQLADDTLPQG